MINFEVFLVRKVPKSSVSNRECLEISVYELSNNLENSKWVK